MKRPKKIQFIFLTVFVLMLIWIASSYFEKGLFFSLLNGETQSVLDYIDSFGIYAQVIFMLIVILEVVLAPIPPLILYVVAGLLFGAFYGGILVLFGNTIGAYIDFMLARLFLRKPLTRKINKKLRVKFDKYFNSYGYLAVFLLRVNPFTSSDLVSYLAGLTKMRLGSFILATFLGLAPLVFVQTYLGHSLLNSNPLLGGIALIFSLIYLLIFFYLIIISLINNRADHQKKYEK